MKFDLVPINLSTGRAYWLAPQGSAAVSWNQMTEREYFEDCLTHLLRDDRVASEYSFFIASDLNDPSYLQQFRKFQRKRRHSFPIDDVEPVGTDPSRKPVLLYLSRESAIPVSSKTSARFHTVFQTPLTMPKASERIFPLQIGAFNGVWCSERPTEKVRDVALLFAGMLTQARARVVVRVSERKNWRTILYDLVSHVPSTRLLQKLVDIVSPPPFAKGLRGRIIFTSRWAGGVTPALYKAQLLNSRAVLCLRGNICVETFRHYKSASAGCIVITQRMPDTYVFRGNPFVEVDDINGWLPALQALANEGDEALAKRSQANRQFWEDRLSPRAAAEYISRQLSSPTAL